MDVFRSDDLLRAAIRRAYTIWPDRYGANASCLRRMLRSFPSAASVSNYRPTTAKAIVEKYSPEASAILDFSAGYGGRMLGTLAAGRRYIGVEPNASQVRGCRRMQRAIGNVGFALPQATLIHGAAEESLPEMQSAVADLVFSSPPFFNWERYSQNKAQSFRRYPTYELWERRFLRPVLAECYRILRRKGMMAINVTNGNRLPTADVVSDAARQTGFAPLEVLAMVFPKTPYLHPRDGSATKRELIMLFRK
jgi:SAM-dependent methyltransferase